MFLRSITGSLLIWCLAFLVRAAAFTMPLNKLDFPAARWGSPKLRDDSRQANEYKTPITRVQMVASSASLAAESKSFIFSDAAKWHRRRRKEMMAKYGDIIRPLETNACSQSFALPLLVLSNLSLLGLSVLAGTTLTLWQTALLAILPGSILSLWQLQLLHDVLHGSLYDKSASRIFGMPKRDLMDATLFWGSLPCVFGYYLYLKCGHLSHHNVVGDADSASLKQLFDSDQADFEDGDVLFVAHRMKLKGDIGPTFSFPKFKVTMSISKSGFDQWKPGSSFRNTVAFATSFLFERSLLVWNDVVVSVTGRNFFFPNKPAAFHKDCQRYAMAATILRGLLWGLAGWKSLFFLYLSETLWSIPPHPAAAMFVTNHGSAGDAEDCRPTSSTYAGPWYSLLTLGTNYHCEHHDFPTIPLHRLGELQNIAPEYYPKSEGNVWKIMNKAFNDPDWYACMDVGVGSGGRLQK